MTTLLDNSWIVHLPFFMPNSWQQATCLDVTPYPAYISVRHVPYADSVSLDQPACLRSLIWQLHSVCLSVKKFLLTRQWTVLLSDKTVVQVGRLIWSYTCPFMACDKCCLIRAKQLQLNWGNKQDTTVLSLYDN